MGTTCLRSIESAKTSSTTQSSRTPSPSPSRQRTCPRANGVGCKRGRTSDRSRREGRKGVNEQIFSIFYAWRFCLPCVIFMFLSPATYTCRAQRKAKRVLGHGLPLSRQAHRQHLAQRISSRVCRFVFPNGGCSRSTTTHLQVFFAATSKSGQKKKKYCRGNPHSSEACFPRACEPATREAEAG